MQLANLLVDHFEQLPEPWEPSPDHLAALPSTDVLAKRLVGARAALASLEQRDMSPQAKALLIRQGTAEVNRLVVMHQHAEQRDRLQASRPAGCWCLGRGGKRPAALWYWCDDRIVPLLSEDGDEVTGWRVYCECPDGVAQRTAHADLVAIAQAQAEQGRLARILAVGEIPPLFHDCQLSSYPGPRHVVDEIQAWLDSAPQQKARDGQVHWLVLWGETTGTGKSALAAVILREWMESGSTGLFVFVPDLLDKIKATFDRVRDSGELRESELMQHVNSVGVLVLDDVGAEHKTPWSAETLTQLINERYVNRRLTILTTNKTPDDLGEYLGDRAASRLFQRRLTETIHVDGDDLRLLPA